MSRPTKARGTVQEQKAPTLTERECWRLMGQSDEDFDKAKAAGVSRTQLYRQAGNSIVVPVLEAIFRGMYIDGSWERKKPTLEDFATEGRA